jgi:quinoprotein relay system zinc metallohydrolase 1
VRPSRRAALAGAAALCALRAPVFAAARSPYDLTPVEVADGVWMIEGATEYFSPENGGAIVNVAFIETDAGAVLIDTGPSRRYGEALRTAMAARAPQGVAAVLMTHHHPDHWFGNQAFADRPIHALGATREGAEAHGGAYAEAMYRLVGDWMRGTEPLPPAMALEGPELTVGGRALLLLPLGGHTAADLAVLDRRTGTLVAGDLAFLNRAPTTPDADLARWRASLTEIEALGAGAIVPGHGPFDRTGDSLRQTRAYLDWLEATLTAAANGGLSMAEAGAAALPAEFAAMGAQPREFARSVSHLYPALERAALPTLE